MSDFCFLICEIFAIFGISATFESPQTWEKLELLNDSFFVGNDGIQNDFCYVSHSFWMFLSEEFQIDCESHFFLILSGIFCSLGSLNGCGIEIRTFCCQNQNDVMLASELSLNDFLILNDWIRENRNDFYCQFSSFLGFHFQILVYVYLNGVGSHFLTDLMHEKIENGF